MDQDDDTRREKMDNKETWIDQFSPSANAHRAWLLPGIFTQV